MSWKDLIDILLHNLLALAILTLAALAGPFAPAVAVAIALYLYEVGQHMIDDDLPFHKALDLNKSPHKHLEWIIPSIFAAIINLVFL